MSKKKLEKLPCFPWYLDCKVVKSNLSLRAQLVSANETILEYEQTEAAVCPEDVGIKEYTESLFGKLTTANEQNERLQSRIKSEEEIRNDNIQEAFVDSDIDYLCMLASYGRQVVRAGWLKTFARKIKTAIDQLATANDENKRLREFARHVIRQECWSIPDLDGGDIQEWAERLGLIVPHAATAEDVDDKSDFEVGDTIFKFSDILKG